MPMFADAINFPIVLTLGLLVLAPLIAFETFTEAFVLSRLWKCPARQLWIFAFIANCLSLAAGIPAKIINSYLYDWLLPNDLPSYFAAYPSAIALGSLIYFLITIIVEARNQSALSPNDRWQNERFQLALHRLVHLRDKPLP